MGSSRVRSNPPPPPHQAYLDGGEELCHGRSGAIGIEILAFHEELVELGILCKRIVSEREREKMES